MVSVRLRGGTQLSGMVAVPPSKSYTHRALFAALLASGTSEIINPLWSLDTEATMNTIAAFGSNIYRRGDRLLVESQGADSLSWTPCINVGESGTTMRLSTGIAALLDKPVLVYGSGRIGERPIKPLLQALAQLGARYLLSNGCCPPHVVMGPLRRGSARIDAWESSQYVSALLYAAAGLGELHVLVERVSSKPYIDMTIKVLEAFGVTVEREGYSRLWVKGRPKPTSYRVWGDWSSAASLAAAIAAAGGRAVLKGLARDDPHPDSSVADLLAVAGARVRWMGDAVEVSSPGPGGLEAFEWCFQDAPDLAMPAASLAAVACGVSKLCCISRLSLKESDRVAAILDVLKTVGATAYLVEDSRGACLEVRGLCGVRGGRAVIDSHRDHRIAMMASAICLSSLNECIILGSDSVAKSYPGYWQALRRLGAIVEERR
ncbi:MAG: 3-phosphoshikimate 1-carboxyvinyltransferase [Hyperthermus sp.]|nr:MAG: 3-phosphoshikimate 1-carboxyvinyltransferase [Hyperthermus sp.]